MNISIFARAFKLTLKKYIVVIIAEAKCLNRKKGFPYAVKTGQHF